MNLEEIKEFKEQFEFMKKLDELVSKVQEMQEIEHKCNTSSKNEKDEIENCGLEWHDVKDYVPSDDQNILVTWKDSRENWHGPYRAYYDCESNCFFAIDCQLSFPIKIDRWMHMPEYPKN